MERAQDTGFSNGFPSGLKAFRSLELRNAEGREREGRRIEDKSPLIAELHGGGTAEHGADEQGRGEDAAGSA